MSHEAGGAVFPGDDAGRGVHGAQAAVAALGGGGGVLGGAGVMALAFACALARALDSEAALWHVGEYGRVAPAEEVGDGLE